MQARVHYALYKFVLLFLFFFSAFDPLKTISVAQRIDQTIGKSMEGYEWFIQLLKIGVQLLNK